MQSHRCVGARLGMASREQLRRTTCPFRGDCLQLAGQEAEDVSRGGSDRAALAHVMCVQMWPAQARVCVEVRPPMPLTCGPQGPYVDWGELPVP